MSDFVSRLLGAGDADSPPIRPLIGSLFEPRRRMRAWSAEGELPLLPAGLSPSARLAGLPQPPPADDRELPVAPPATAPPPAELLEHAAPDRAPELPQAVGAEPPAAPARPAQPSAFAFPKPRRSGAAPEEAGQETLEESSDEVPQGVQEEVLERQHTTPAEPPRPDAPTALAPDPVRAHPVPASLVDPPLTSRRERAAAPPNVRITIGRVEVRANRQPPAPQPPRRIPGRRPAMSLEDYLRTRSEGGGAK